MRELILEPSNQRLYLATKERQELPSGAGSAQLKIYRVVVE